MTLASMTGFARIEGAHDGLRWFWECRSVNGRGLDLRFRLPPGFESVEPAARALAMERFKRGSLSLSLNMQQKSSAPKISVNMDVLAQVAAAVQAVRAQTDAGPPTAGELLALRGVLEADETAPTETELTARDAAVLNSLSTALDAMGKARAEEGRRLAAVLNGQVSEIERLTREAGLLAATQPEAMRARLQAQVQTLLDAGASVAPERLAQELALLAAKADIREELDRLTAHVAQARGLLKEGAGAGRRLDFLAQEFNREANTLCSKSSDIALTQTGLALKAVIDQFKEQVQNVE
jgi:uncharacterized protein (TIGR00255 family)